MLQRKSRDWLLYLYPTDTSISSFHFTHCRNPPRGSYRYKLFLNTWNQEQEWRNQLCHCLTIHSEMPNIQSHITWYVAVLCVLIRGVLEFSDGSYIFGKFLHSSYRIFIYCFVVNDERDEQIPLYVFIFIFNSLHVSSTSCSSSGETNCVNTTPGGCHSVSVAVSCAGRKFTSDLHTVPQPTATRVCIDTVCLSWWWTRCARNM
jgi:hypothetical protein